MLAELFELQAALNKRIGNDTQALHDNFDPLKAGVMLNDYLVIQELAGLSREKRKVKLEELGDE